MQPRSNHRIVVTRRGGPDVLQVVEEPLPQPEPGQIRVKVLSAGVSGFDLMMRQRSFPGFPKPPFTPGVDIVGLVDEAGVGVVEPARGERVAALVGVANGGYAEYVCLPAADAVPVPAGVDPASAVCTVANYLTAHLALHTVAGAKSGERALIQGAAGGVGTALLDLGRIAGLEMYGTASPHNQEVVAGFGATPIDYHREDVVERVRSLTGDGVDIVLDPIGGARQLWRSYRTLRGGGRLVWFGVAASKTKGARVIPFSLLMRFLLPLIPDRKKVKSTPNLMKDHERYRSTLASLLDSLASGRINPIVAERVPLLEAARAHAMMEQGPYAGKIVLIAGE